MIAFSKRLLLSTCIAVVASSAYAADEPVSQDEISSKFEIAFGIAATTNYISRGATQSSNLPALQMYVEPSFGIFYVGAWASTLDLRAGSADEFELDLYAGIRPEFGDLSLDLGYARYIYSSSGDCCGEIYAKASYALNDYVAPGLEFYWDPQSSTTWSVAKADFSGLPLEFAASAQIGTDFGTLALGSDKYAWDIGVSRSFFDDVVTADIRYHDSNYDPAQVVFSLSADF